MIGFGNEAYLIYYILAAAIVTALFAWYLIWKRAMMKRLFSNPSIRSKLIKGRFPVAAVRAGIIFLCILIFVLAVLRPRWGERIREARLEGVDVLVALDVSNSMLARDVNPGRLERSKDAARLLADSLRGDRIGLLLFAGEAFIQCPFTSDMGAFNMFLDAAGPSSVNIQGTDMGVALETARRVFQKRRITSRYLVFITDGENHGSAVEKAAAGLRELDVTTFIVGIGREGGEVIPMPEESGSSEPYLKDGGGNIVRTAKNTGFLRTLAGDIGAEYYDITDGFSGIYRIKSRIREGERGSYGSRIVREPKEQYWIFALILAVLLMIEPLLPERAPASSGKAENKRGKAAHSSGGE